MKGSTPPTPAPVQPVASATDVPSVDSVAVQGHSNAVPLHAEQQQVDRCATRATRGRPKKNPVQSQVDFPQGPSQIPADRHAAKGEGRVELLLSKRLMWKTTRNSENDQLLIA